MRIGVISDVHSNAFALARVLEKLHDQGVERILCAGDLVGYGSQPNRTIRLLRFSGVESILGNHDDGIINGTPSDFNIHAKRALDWNRRNLNEKYIEYLTDLDPHNRERIEDTDVFIVHGTPRSPLSGYIYSDDISSDFLDFSFDARPDILIMGQTHVPFIKQVEDTLVVNPGSVGQPRDGDPRASCSIIDLSTREAETLRVDYDQQKMADDIIQYLPKPLAERILSGE